MNNKIEQGQNAPLFGLKNQDNKEIQLNDYRGKNVILYFYPKDDTPGCTIEAQDFTKKQKFCLVLTVVGCSQRTLEIMYVVVCLIV